jgi:hypothetical protein
MLPGAAFRAWMPALIGATTGKAAPPTRVLAMSSIDFLIIRGLAWVRAEAAFSRRLFGASVLAPAAVWPGICETKSFAGYLASSRSKSLY